MLKKTLLVTLALGFACSGIVRAQTPADDHAQIVALEQRFVRAFRAKSLDAIMKVYEPGNELFVFDVGPPRQHVGAADYRQDWKELFAGFKGALKFDISALNVVTDGTLGYGHSIQRVRGTMQDGSAADFTVRVTDVYRKIGGTWYVVQEHVSLPVDLATGKADFNSKP